jgi:hypothetical protein
VNDPNCESPEPVTIVMDDADEDDQELEKFPEFDHEHWEREGSAMETFGVNAIWAGFWDEVNFHLSREDYIAIWVDEYALLL